MSDSGKASTHLDVRVEKPWIGDLPPPRPELGDKRKSISDEWNSDSSQKTTFGLAILGRQLTLSRP